MPNIYCLWFENVEDYRIAVCKIAAGNDKVAIKRAKPLLDKPEEYVYVRYDTGKNITRLAEHHNCVEYFNCWLLPVRPDWAPEFLKALLYDQAGDDLIDGSAVKIETILSSLRHTGAPTSTWRMDPAVVAELARLINEFCRIRCWTWNDPEEKDEQGNDLPCIIHLDVPGH